MPLRAGSPLRSDKLTDSSRGGEETVLGALISLGASLSLTPIPKHPIFVEDYRDGLFCLRHTKGAYKGRCLFFTERGGDPVALLVYRKESAKADPRAIERARNRMKEYEKHHE